MFWHELPRLMDETHSSKVGERSSPLKTSKPIRVWWSRVRVCRLRSIEFLWTSKLAVRSFTHEWEGAGIELLKFHAFGRAKDRQKRCHLERVLELRNCWLGGVGERVSRWLKLSEARSRRKVGWGGDGWWARKGIEGAEGVVILLRGLSFAGGCWEKVVGSVKGKEFVNL